MSVITKGVTAEMPNTKYRQGKRYAADMATYIKQIDPGNSGEEHGRLIHNLARCIREELTPRQRDLLMRYYVSGQNQREIAEELGINKSTVSRTIQRGEERLRLCLRYGAERYLRGMNEGG